MQYRRDKVVLRTTCIKNVKFEIINIRTGCQYLGYLYCKENIRLGSMRPDSCRLDIADLASLN